MGASELKKTDGTEEDCYRENGNIRKANGGEFFESQSANSLASGFAKTPPARQAERAPFSTNLSFVKFRAFRG